VTALGSDHKAACAKAYEAAERITFDGIQYRTDICAEGV
ncbi:MAG TPA: hypothetical protein EYG58_06280, partial [Nitrospirales bacterium]|nr:hypothetical protein [Nitrospirales bacterium]